MHETKKITLAAKSAPDEKIFTDIMNSDIEAVELYISEETLEHPKKVISLCKKFPFKYALHANNTGYNPERLAELAIGTEAKIVVFHNIYWEEEWDNIHKIFKNTNTKPCVENTSTIHESLKFMRRYGWGRCLDLEHLQLECAGVYEEEFIKVIGSASHIHLTGYMFGSSLWHTHIHESAAHGFYLLDLIKKAGYSGMVVSEAKTPLQNLKEFRKLRNYFLRWSKR